MIAKLELSKENRKFVVRDKGCRQIFLGSFSCVIGIHSAMVLGSAKEAHDLITKNVDRPSDWEVEQIVVC